MRNDRGFTLVEIVASIVILSIVLISLAQILVQTNKMAVHNNDKLVAINLAEAELERLKLNPFDTNEQVRLKALDTNPTYPYTLDDETKDLYSGGPQYVVIVNADQTSDEKANKLINVTVKVTLNKTSSTVEGYVQYE